MLTAKQREVIARARLTRATFIEIPRLGRDTACDYHRNQWAEEQAARVTALLAAEQQRLINEWSKQ